eukprot:4494382-Alexandrium_andersonii.AAC.1
MAVPSATEAAITANEACGHRLNLLAAQSTSPVSACSTSPSETAMTKRRSLPKSTAMCRRTWIKYCLLYTSPSPRD